MTSIQPELWVETPGESVAFYEAAFGATVLHRVGEGDDVVAQLGVGDAAFWVAATSAVRSGSVPALSMARPAERCSWSKTPTASSGRRSPPALTLIDRTWVLITESPEGGWGVNGHANTGADIVAAARAALQAEG